MLPRRPITRGTRARRELLDDVCLEEVASQGCEGRACGLHLAGDEVLDLLNAAGAGDSLREAAENGIGEASENLVLEV